MRIAVWHNLPSGGAKRALYDQVRGLVARGHEVEAWCPPTADRGYLPLGDLVREHVVPLSFRGGSEPRSFFQKLHPLRFSVRAKLRAMNRHSIECAHQMEAGGFDLLFAACCIMFHTPAIGRFSRIPSVLYLQEPNRSLYECSPDLPWVAVPWKGKDLLRAGFWQKGVIRRLKFPGLRVLAREERLNAMAFDQVLVNSLFSRESVLRAFGIDCKVSYLGIDTERFANLGKKREKFAVCLAALLRPKNIEFLLQALARVPMSNRPQLVLISNMVDEAYLQELRGLADDLGVKFELKYRIEDHEVIDILNRARVMLYASRLEPFGLAPLEANACGLPVIAVAEGGVRETIQDEANGLLVDSDPQSMADAMQRLFADGGLYQRLSDGGYRLTQGKWSLPFSIDVLERHLR